MALTNSERQKRYKLRNPKKARSGRVKNRKIIREFLSNNKCECGEYNPNKLCFHHKNNSEKDFKITNLVSYSTNRLLSEISKCIVLCQNCHAKLHIELKYKDRLFLLLNSYKNSPRYKRYNKESKLLLYFYKETCNCLNCNHDYNASLCFHHIDFATKKKAVSLLKTIPSINKELSKTICLCRNCHEDFHCKYGRKTNQSQLEQYIGKNVEPLKVDIKDYLPLIEQNISKYYNLSFSL